ncbi:MAG: hypothetical protein B7Z75_10645 [Acidocella sp. 20-57-95]|nr:MAG: hypothetical protein B7Z75_10645 [Acidocella sp. 20-57-95]HQT64920.1 hypothetical protein [Acidocella sp.]
MFKLSNRQAWLAGLIGCLALLALYIPLFATEQINADQVNALYLAQDMLAGNWRLHHWWMAPDNYWGLDELIFAAVWTITHNAILTIRLVPIIGWMCLGIIIVILGAGADLKRGKYGSLLILAAIIIIPISGPFVTDFYFNAPLHIPTIAAIFLVIAILEPALPAVKLGFGRIIALGLISIDAAFSDPLFIYVGILPIIIALLLLSSAAVPKRLQIIAILIGSLILAKLALYLNSTTGGFSFYSLPYEIHTLAELPAVIYLDAQGILSVFGCWSPVLQFPDTAIALIRVPLLIFILMPCFAAGIAILKKIIFFRTTKHQLDFIETVLCLMIMANLFALIVPNTVQKLADIRFFLPSWVALAILAARHFRLNFLSASYFGIVCVVAIMTDIATCIQGRNITPFPEEPLSVAAALEAHHLHYGYAIYWEASETMAAGDGSLTVRSISPNPSGPGIVSTKWFTKADWYLGNPNTKQFFVLIPYQHNLMTAQDVITSFGKPAEIVPVGADFIYIYNGPLPALN